MSDSSPTPYQEQQESIQGMFRIIISRLDLIEQRLDEAIYPPEEQFSAGFIKHVEKQEYEMKSGHSLSYNDADELFSSLNE
jgi:hypothetical protein